MQRKAWTAVLIAVLLVLGAVGTYLNYRAYRLRFPDAPAWTWFFPH